jgi:hypothetical protein
MGLLPLAKDADGIVCPTPSTWIGAVTLHRVSAASERADACFWIVACLPSISSIYIDRTPYTPSCEHCRPNVSGPMWVTIDVPSLCGIGSIN